MTTLREAAQQALEAMDKATRFMSDSDYKKLNEAIDDLRAALADPVQDHFPDVTKMVQEPVAWRITDGEGDWEYRTDLPEDWSIQWSARYGRRYEPLYSAPIQRKPLAVFEIDAIAEHLDKTTIGWSTHEFAAAIEKAHGIGGEA